MGYDAEFEPVEFVFARQEQLIMKTIVGSVVTADGKMRLTLT